MRTWLIYAIALSTAATACAQAPGQPEISILNSTSIFVRWQWTGDNVGPQDARFEVSAIAGGVDSKNVSVSGKQYIVLDGLTPGKQYEIRAAFVKADQSRIPSDPASITLPQTDLKAPASVKIEAGERSNPLSVPYTVSWEFEADSSEGELTGFKVLYCTVSCDVDDAGSGKKSSKSLNYYTEVTVIVLAIFKGADGATSEIGSTPATVRTVTGQPGPVENLNVEQKRDSLEVNVHWLPPNRPNGEIVAYALEVKAGDFDVITTNIADPKVAEYTYFVTTGEIASKPHDIKVRAINNAEDAFKTGAPAEKQLEIVKPDPPTTVNLTSCTSDTLGISIVRENDGELTFRILYNYNETIETKEQNVVLSGFEAYKDVPVEVSVCLPLEIDFFCGGSNKNVFKTNVGVPSQVRNLTVTAAGNNETSSGTVTLNWLQPETPAGPIDGYVVKITDKTGGGVEEIEVKQVLEYSPSALKNCTQYEFAVMAFNVDLVSHAKVNGSLSEVRSFTTVNCDENGGGSGFPAWAIVLIVLLILGAAGGGAYYYLKMRREA